MISSFWSDFTELLKEPLMLEGILVLMLFAIAVISFQKLGKIAAELERRKELGQYVSGLDQFLRGDYPEAIETLDKVLERDPENVEARIALGDCYREVGDAAEAKKNHHHVHRVFGHELTRNFLSLGKDELALRNYDLAVEAFQRALELSPQESDALAGLAQANADGGNPIAAAGYLRELYPNGPSKDMSLAKRREASKRFAEAAQATLRDGDAEGAIRLYSEALAFQPENIRARTGLVRAAHELDDEARARELVAEHLEVLKQLSEDESVLFEPGAPVKEADAAEESHAREMSYLPARVEEVGGVVAAVERKTARYHCGACGALQREYVRVCPACQSVGTIAALPALSGLYMMPLTGFREAIDEVEGSSAYFQRLARKASDGDGDALQKLVERGTASLYEVFAALPGIAQRRFLGMKMAESLGAAAAIEVQQCHAARRDRPQDEFAAAYYLTLKDPDAFLTSLEAARDTAVAGVMADPRLEDAIRDAAITTLKTRGEAALVPSVDAAADSGDLGAIERAAQLVTDNAAVALIGKRYLQANLLGRLFRGAHGARRRAAADILARTGLDAAKQALGRAAAKEKDSKLREHYLRAKERAELK